jgi:ribose 5-phosphate isomerase B
MLKIGGFFLSCFNASSLLAVAVATKIEGTLPTLKTFYYLCMIELEKPKNNPYSMKKIGIACDHAGYEMKEFLVGCLAAKGFEVLDFGTASEESVDYPDFAHQLGEAIDKGELEIGVGLCGSGEGMAMTLNKHQSVRAGLVWCNEVAGLIRQHNNANVVVLPARFISNDEAMQFVSTFLETPFEGDRHERRVEKIKLQ